MWALGEVPDIFELSKVFVLVQNHLMRTQRLQKLSLFSKLFVNNGTSREEKSTGIPTINNVEDATQAFHEDWFIPGKWINFQNQKEE